MICLIVAAVIMVLVMVLSIIITPELKDPDERKDFLKHL